MKEIRRLRNMLGEEEPGLRRYGVLVISHGSRDEAWIALVDQAVAEVELPEAIPVYSSFLEIVEGRLIEDGIRALEEQGVTDLIVVPLFVSSGSTHVDEISYVLGVIDEPSLPTDLKPLDIRARVHFCSPIDDDESVAGILLEKLAPLSRRPQQELVLLVGHGSVEKGFGNKWRRGLESLAEQLKQLGGFAETDIAMLLPDQLARKMKWWARKRPELTVIVAPLFLSEGYFTGQVIPRRLQGSEYRYNGKALLPHPLISRWMERRMTDMLQAIDSDQHRTGGEANGEVEKSQVHL